MNTFLIARRELATYLKTPAGYVIAAVALFGDGLLFSVPFPGVATLARPALSSEVLDGFFYLASFWTGVSCVLLSMRLLAEERQTGTITLLFTSPVREVEIVLGKFLSAWLFFACITAVTLYMPLLILVNGKVSVGHIVSGYLGLLLFGSATLSVGLFGSSLARSQVVAAVVSTAMVVAMVVLWSVGQIADPPFDSVLASISLHNRRFFPFQKGIVELANVVFYLSVTYVFLLATTKVLESRRWR